MLEKVDKQEQDADRAVRMIAILEKAIRELKVWTKALHVNGSGFNAAWFVTELAAKLFETIYPNGGERNAGTDNGLSHRKSAL